MNHKTLIIFNHLLKNLLNPLIHASISLVHSGKNDNCSGFFVVNFSVFPKLLIVALKTRSQAQARMYDTTTYLLERRKVEEAAAAGPREHV